MQHDRERGKVALQPVHDFVAQPRHFAVLLRREPLQHRVARVHDEHLAAGFRHRTDEVAHEAVVLVGVEADAMLHGHGQRHRIAHRAHAVRHQRRLRHEAGAEAPRLDTLRWTAAVQVDLVVAPSLAELRGMREHRRIAAAQLQRQRMLLRVEVQMARHVAVHERGRRHHLGVQARMARDLAQEEPAMPVGPVHHGGSAEAM